MKKILILNSGSSSVKFELFACDTKLKSLAEGLVDGIQLETSKFTLKSKSVNLGINIKVKNHRQAIKLILENLLSQGIIEKYKEITALGHRVVHGGEIYTEITKIDAKVLRDLKKLSKLAPLHNPANIEGIKACQKILPKTPQFAVFDTQFYKTLPEKAYLYALPREFYEKHHIRRYGFHGTNHKYIAEKAIQLLKKKNTRIISCHIGNGSSITASLNGHALDTSMGFTPLEGLPMGTRSGTIDPAIVTHLLRNTKFTPAQIEEILLRKSGLLALSEISSDMREIYAAYKKKDPKAILTIELLSYQIAKLIGSYTAVLNGVDAIVFSGGMGEKAHYIREKALQNFSHLGLEIDKKLNRGNESIISTSKSKVKVFIIPADEELQIASEVKRKI